MDEFKENIELLGYLGLVFDSKPANDDNYWFYINTVSGEKLMDGHGKCSVDWVNRNMVHVKKLISYKLNPIDPASKEQLDAAWKKWNEKWEDKGNDVFERFSFKRFVIRELVAAAEKPLPKNKEAFNVMNIVTYRQLIVGKLAEHLDPELSRELAQEIIDFGVEHKLLNE